MWKNKKIIDWALIISGILVVIFSISQLLERTQILELYKLKNTPAVDQEGFAPIFIPAPEESNLKEVGESASSSLIPDRIIIDEIGLDAPVVTADSINVIISGKEAVQFLVPEKYAAGWHENSAPLGETGNTVISGHHNAYDKVFEHLTDLNDGDEIILMSGDEKFTYRIAKKLILSEKDQPLNVRLENGWWILPSNDERITLVTCWPKNSNSHRLILVAIPSEE